MINELKELIKDTKENDIISVSKDLLERYSKYLSGSTKIKENEGLLFKNRLLKVAKQDIK